MTTTPNSDLVLGLPELLTQIAVNLKPPSLAACTRVSHLWNKVFTPQLWYTIDDHRYNWSKAADSRGKYDRETGSWIPISTEKEDCTRQLFLKFGHHIRHLLISDWTVAKAALHNYRGTLQLKSLWFTLPVDRTYTTVERPALLPKDMAEKDREALEGFLQPDVKISRDFNADVWQLVWQLWLVIFRTPALCNLKVFMPASRTLDRVLSPTFLRRALLVHHKTLTTLQISFRQLNLADYMDILPHLQHFYTEHNPVENRPLEKTYPQLRTLFICAHLPEPTFFNLLKYLPSLEDFCVSNLWGVPADDVDDDADWDGDEDSDADYNGSELESDAQVSPLLDGVPSRLSRLHFLVKWGSYDERMLNVAFRVLPSVPFVTELTMDAGYPYLGPLVAKYCPQLEVLRCPSSLCSIHLERSEGKVAVNGLNIILESCPHLRVFEAIASRIEVSHMLGRTWICKDLEVFRCQIIGFHRLSHDEEMVYGETVQILETTIYELLSDEQQRVFSKYRQCQEQHHQVYDRLASMTQLTTLELGHDMTRHRRKDQRIVKWRRYSQENRTYTVDNAPVLGAMELSMSSGLDRLVTLEKLEIFGFSSIDDRIQEPELEWMAKAWPRLMIMRGLHYVQLMEPFHFEDPKTRRLREKMLELRPDVRHEKFFDVAYHRCYERVFPFGGI